MIQYEKITGALAPDSSLPTLVRSEDAQAFATFPDFVLSLHPEYLTNSNENPIERSTGIRAQGPGKIIPTGTFPNGSIGFDIKALHNPSAGRLAFNPNEMPGTEFSFFFAKQLQTVSLSGVVADIYSSSTDREQGFRITLTTSSRVVAYKEGVAIVTDPLPANPTSPPSFTMITFSVDEGWKIYRNGVIVGTNTMDKDPITTGLEAGTNQLFRASTIYQSANMTKFLCSGIYAVSIDLSKTEHTSKLAAINNYMMQKYVN